MYIPFSTVMNQSDIIHPKFPRKKRESLRVLFLKIKIIGERRIIDAQTLQKEIVLKLKIP